MTTTGAGSQLTYQDRMAAFEAGYELGLAAKVDALAEQRAHEIMHADAAAALGFARREATKRHGPAWAALVVCDDDEGAGDE